MRLFDTLERLSLKRLLALGSWLAAMGAALYLWTDQGGSSHAQGFAQRSELQLAAAQTASIASLAVSLGQRVHAGQLLLILDTSDLEAQLEVARARRRQVAAAITEAAARTRADTLAAASDLGKTEESYRADLAQARSSLKVKAAELEALDGQLAELSQLLAQRMAVRQDLAELRVRRATLRSELQEAKSAARLLKRQLAAAVARRQALPANAEQLATAPLEAQLEQAQAEIARLELLLARARLRAPVDGVISGVLRQPGEVVGAGEPLVTLVQNNTSQVIACVSEQQAAGLALGQQATVRARDAAVSYRGRIVALGPAVGEVPARCRPAPNQPAWGREVALLLEAPAPLTPGQSFDVSFRQPPSDDGLAYAAPLPRPAGAPQRPQLIRVPQALRQASRFEPSGAVWVPQLARYVLVSDDTGRGRTKNEPWLFTMSSSGELDPTPLRIEGLEQVNDLEAIAPGPAGSLYVLASQSLNKKGRRKPARELFAQLLPVAGGYRVAGQVRLVSLLQAATPELRTALGLSELDALDLEGLTAHGDGLLLGLKAPLTAAGQAIIWRLADPAALLQGGSLADAGLSRWSEVRLEVTADGQPTPGGIAELLCLPSGALVIAATASAGDPRRQSGVLLATRCDQPQTSSAPQPLLARPLYPFPGRKPEGLALSPLAGQLAVFFDAGDRDASWLEVPWPR